MTQYFTDFSGSTPGATPTGWTATWNNTGDWLYNAGGYVEVTPTSSANSALYWSDLGSLTACEILVKFRISTVGGASIFGATTRLGTAGYVGLFGNDIASCYLTRQNSSSTLATLDFGTPIFPPVNTTDYWIRMQSDGTAHKWRIWADGDSEPGTWELEATDSNYSSGFIGIWARDSTSVTRVYQVGVTDSPSTESAPSEALGDAFPPAGGLTITAIPPNVGPIPAGDLQITALVPVTGVFAYPPAPDLQITGLAPNIETLTFAPVGALAIAAQAPFLSVTPPADAVRVYRVKITIAGETTYAVPVNWQARYAIDRSNYLSVTLHAPEQSLIDLLNDAIGSSPAETVTLVIQGGYRWPDGSAYYRDMITSEMQDVTTSTGPRSSSTLLSGYLSADAGVVKAVTLPSAITIRSGTVATVWVGPIDIDLAPGDQVTVPDTGATFVVGNITYRVDSRNATMDVSELTDADVLATLPW